MLIIQNPEWTCKFLFGFSLMENLDSRLSSCFSTGCCPGMVFSLVVLHVIVLGNI